MRAMNECHAHVLREFLHSRHQRILRVTEFLTKVPEEFFTADTELIKLIRDVYVPNASS